MKKRTLAAVALACLLSSPLSGRAQDLDAALQAARQGRVDEALAAVDAALAANPDDARALFARGVILAESGRGDEAAGIFRQLIDGHPELPEAYNNLAVIQAADGDFDAAVSTLKNALATNASYQTAYENLTRIFAQLASEAYSRALEVDSPPARNQVELEMLADLSIPAQAMPMTEDEASRAAPSIPATAIAESPASESGAEEIADATPEVEGEDLGLAELEPVEPAEPVEPDEPVGSTFALSQVVDGWARAWSEQRVDDYLAFYAPDFVPDNGMTRGDWESNRRERIGAPEYINVQVAIVDSVLDGTDKAKVTFLQSYESNTYRDQVTKTLTLVHDGADWRIVEEKSDS